LIKHLDGKKASAVKAPVSTSHEDEAPPLGRSRRGGIPRTSESVGAKSSVPAPRSKLGKRRAGVLEATEPEVPLVVDVAREDIVQVVDSCDKYDFLRDVVHGNPSQHTRNLSKQRGKGGGATKSVGRTGQSASLQRQKQGRKGEGISKGSAPLVPSDPSPSSITSALEIKSGKRKGRGRGSESDTVEAAVAIETVTSDFLAASGAVDIKSKLQQIEGEEDNYDDL
jgi:hypothetical protein